jgi:hypothetical protein
MVMSLTFTFAKIDENQRQAAVFVGGLRDDIATKHEKQIYGAVTFLTSKNMIRMLDHHGQTNELIDVFNSLPNFQQRFVARHIIESFRVGLTHSAFIEMWAVNLLPDYNQHLIRLQEQGVAIRPAIAA